MTGVLDPENDRLDDGSLIAVGIGASAGGLEAFTELLRNLPPATGMAFILVQHLDPHYESSLSLLLSRETQMPMVEVTDGTRLEADHVYVIPPNTQMLVRDGALQLEARPNTRGTFCPIDVFFASLAGEFRSNAVGVVLSGTASDGTLGLKSIKASGGITFAQDETAKFDGMPRSAIAAGVVDLVLPPQRISEELAAIARRSPTLQRTAGEFSAAQGKILRRILQLLRKQHNVDFTEYKQPTIVRRINRRMLVRNAESLERYLEILQDDSDELKALFDDLLINVTEFFRDTDLFDNIKRTVFPSVVRGLNPPYAIRVWVPGCSTGEEVYSLAISLIEYLQAEDLPYTVQIFGTDISEPAIAKARSAIYDDTSILNVSPERLRRFFSRTEGGYQIIRAVRDLCIFSLHDLTRDPPLSRMNVISCRNLLIYFSTVLQRRVVSTFSYALQPTGCLILGPSETVGALAEHFSVIDPAHKIFCKSPSPPPLGVAASAGEEWRTETTDPQAVPQSAPKSDPGGRIHKEVNQIVLMRYGPAGVVVDETLRIIEYRGDILPFTASGRHEDEDDLFQVLHDALRATVSSLIEQARRTGVAVVADAVPFHRGNAQLAGITITAVPIALTGLTQHFLVLFASADQPGLPMGFPSPLPSDLPASADLADPDLARLSLELKSTREYLQSVVEELRSANEEAQSANEELQSTNEELQTSKEELQASNEELHTINAEMQSRNSELARLNDDLLNLLASMNIPIVMTGSDLRIRRFTPTAQRVLHLIHADVGRPISDLKPRINVPNLEGILKDVLETLQPFEQEVQDQEGQSYLMRVRPYRTADSRIDGTVLQLLDITELKRSVEELRHARDYAEAIVNTVQEPLVVLDQNFAIQNANHAFFGAFRLNDGTGAGQSIFEVARGRFDSPKLRELLEQVSSASRQLGEVEIEDRHEGGVPRVLSVSAYRLDAPGQKRLFLVSLADITERKRAAEARYRRIFESARDGIVLVDEQTGEVVDINPFTEQLLGYGREELVGRALWDVEAMRSVPHLRSALQRIRTEGVLRLDDLILCKKDGSELHTEVIANLYMEGNRQSIQFNIRDVGERKQFERELQETQKLESLGLLAGGIAHDFNNLLTGILGNASLVYSEVAPDDPSRLRLREVIQASERAAFLTRQMLAYAGRGRFVTEVFDLGALVREISALIYTSVPKSVELRLNLAQGLPPIEADPAQVQQVVMNLVINAAEAIGDIASGTVEIKTSLREIGEDEARDQFRHEGLRPGAYVQLEVTDTGAGMDESTRARIFDPFFTTKFTGRGLGLAAVQGIVKAHGGAIRVNSTPGRGTAFVILLPAKLARRTPAKREESRAVRIPRNSVVLVVDDEEGVRSIVVNVLVREGVKVLTAVDGKAGVDLFREHHSSISVVLLDLQMPVMGGEEALKELREIDPTVPVVLSSGFDESEAESRVAAQKPERFLQKPYTRERLLQVLAAAMKKKKK